MIKYFKIIFLISLLFILQCCNKKEDSKQREETSIEGTTTLLVDETVTPIIEDQVQIFESQYNAKINIESKSEAEIIQSLTKNSAQIAVLSRTLNKEELHFFESKKITPRITPFAKDGIALIANKSNKDTLIALQDIIDFIQSKKQTKIKGLVFDNPNSSTTRYIKEKAGVESLPKENIFSFKTNSEAIQYVSENEGLIGVVGLNYILQPTLKMQQFLDKINVLNVKDVNNNNYFYPSQNNIAEVKYPLARDLYIINCQGSSGLGMGFSSFVNGEIGQRIVLKSGLVPVRFPSRIIRIRNEINNDKK